MKGKKLLSLVLGASLMLGAAVGVKPILKELMAESTTVATMDCTQKGLSGTPVTPTTSKTSKKDTYYQDNGTAGTDVCTFTLKNSSALWTTTPQSINFTAVLGGGTVTHDLVSPVQVSLLDSSSNVVSSTTTDVTKKITTAGGDTYNISIPTCANVYGFKLTHLKEDGFNVRYFTFALSYVAASGEGGGSSSSNSSTSSNNTSSSVSSSTANNPNFVWNISTWPDRVKDKAVSPQALNEVVSISKVTHGGTNTRYWDSDLRMYKNGGSITFSVADGYKLDKIVFTGKTPATVDVGTYENLIWTAGSNPVFNVTFTATDTSNTSSVSFYYSTYVATTFNITFDSNGGTFAQGKGATVSGNVGETLRVTLPTSADFSVIPDDGNASLVGWKVGET